MQNCRNPNELDPILWIEGMVVQVSQYLDIEVSLITNTYSNRSIKSLKNHYNEEG